MTTQEVIRRKLRDFRQQNNLTQEEMAERIGVNESYYRKYERDPKKWKNNPPVNPRLSTLQRMAMAMGITLSELLEDEENE